MTDTIREQPRRRSAILVTAVAALLASGVARGDAAPGADPVGTLEEVTVFGRGETRQVTTLTTADLELAVPGTSALKAIDKLPGVSFQSADPFGAYEWSTRISIRGFSQNQLGFTLDGVPLGDMSYGNHNGLHVSRAIASENIGRVVLSQGAGALGTASTSNLGGTLEFYSSDPAPEFGARVAVTGGSESTLRVHGRLDSGEIGDLGTRGYLSYTDQGADKWKGDGAQKQRQVNLKVLQPVGDATVTAFYDWSDRAESDYQDLSPEMIRRLGYGWDNVANDWALAVRLADVGANNGSTGAAPQNPAAGTAFPAPIASVDDAYFDASGLRKDKLGSVTLEAPLAGGLQFRVTAYLHGNEGQGIWFTPYVATPGGGPISVRTTEYAIDRKGAILGLGLELGAHSLGAGYWFESNDFTQARRYYGLGRAAPGRDPLEFMRDPFFTQWEGDFGTVTRQFHVQDRWAIDDAFTLSFGFKSTHVTNRARQVAGPFPNGEIDAGDAFLPQAGANWRFADSMEMFASYTENMRAFVSAYTAGPFGTTAAGLAAIATALEPERSRTCEVGWRYNAGAVEALVTAYKVGFSNRLLALRVGSGIQGDPAVLQNVPGVGTQGIETGLAWAFAPHWSAYGSLTYNRSEYRGNVAAAGSVTPLEGRQAVDAPENLAKFEVAYDDGRLYAKLGGGHVSRRYYTYTNDAGVASYTLFDASGGYRLAGLGMAKELSVQVSATNLAGEKYVSTIGSNGFTNADPDGTGQTLLAGAPRQYFLTLNGRF